MIQGRQFDTVYHEHFSYLSLWTVQRIFDATGLRVFDVDELRTHGGSLRVYGCHHDDPRNSSKSVHRILEDEERHKLRTVDIFREFQSAAEQIKDDLLLFLIEQKRAGKKVVAYGAAAKGNTLLNFAGVKADLLPVVFDAAKSKQDRFLPGSHIPIRSPEAMIAEKADFILILPWNIAAEVAQQLCKQPGMNAVRYVTAVPKISIK
jgi:hypothetical protein